MPPAQIGIPPADYRLPLTTRIGRATLAVSNLERSIAFYGGVIGLSVLNQAPTRATLGVAATQTPLLELEQLPGVQPIASRSRLGLFHTAFLLPNRDALRAFVQHLAENNVNFQAGDHLYSEAFYIEDPDGLTVEVYADRDRSQWPYEAGQIMGDTLPIDFASLRLDSAPAWNGFPEGARIGHMHFHIAALPAADKFYRDGLGFDLVWWAIPSAHFVSAGGYHHHVGLNTWAARSPVAGPADARLLQWELVLPNQAEIARVIESLRAQGFNPTADAPNSVTDQCGITVALTAPAEP